MKFFTSSQPTKSNAVHFFPRYAAAFARTFIKRVTVLKSVHYDENFDMISTFDILMLSISSNDMNIKINDVVFIACELKGIVQFWCCVHCAVRL